MTELLDVKDYIASLPADRRRAIETRSAEMTEDYLTLQELRRARKLTQVKLARKLGVTQKQISAVENRTDMHLSTLRRTIEAMGGTLSLIAKFPNHAPVELKGIAGE